MHGVLQASDELPSTVTCAPAGSVKNWTLCSAPGFGAIVGGGMERSGCVRVGGGSTSSFGAAAVGAVLWGAGVWGAGLWEGGVGGVESGAVASGGALGAAEPSRCSP